MATTVPRMRGDAPAAGIRAALSTNRSPHARGCTAVEIRQQNGDAPFPACAGMHRPR